LPRGHFKRIFLKMSARIWCFVHLPRIFTTADSIKSHVRDHEQRIGSVESLTPALAVLEQRLDSHVDDSNEALAELEQRLNLHVEGSNEALAGLKREIGFVHRKSGVNYKRAWAPKRLGVHDQMLPKLELAPYNGAVPIVFMHIPKTSGVALTQGLTEALAPRRTLRGFDRVLFGGFCDFDSIAWELRRDIYLDPAAVPTDADLVAAHMSVATTTIAYPRAQHMTVLREPHSRILSHWLYWRSQAEGHLAWGKWGHVLREARNPLDEFLASRDVACQVDNLFVRMLLWPHRLIPDDDFIASCHDEKLLDEAIARLNRFAYVDLIENPNLRINLENWLGRPFTYRRANETMPLPPHMKTTLHEELTPRALDLLEAHGRLDLKLWLALARQRVPDLKAEILRERVLIGNVARYAWLMLA
jgi:hypothetical protein